MINLARDKALVQDSYSVEALARVDVLCLDKTGTITDGTMRVENHIVYDESVDVETGEFGAFMKVSLLNNGPVTILLEKEFE